MYYKYEYINSRDSTLEEHLGVQGFYDWLKSRWLMAEILELIKGLII